MNEQDRALMKLDSSTRQDKKQFSFSSLVIHFILLILAAVVIVPLLLPFVFCFKTPLEFNMTPWAFPKQFLWENFQAAWDGVRLGIGMTNSFIVCIGTVLLTVPISAMAGYIFSRYRTKVTEVLFYFIMIGFFVPAQMVLIPLYKVEMHIGVIDSLPGVIFALTTFGIPFWTMIYRSFYSSLPGELMESARIDGAGHWTIFFKIMLPLAKAASALAILLTFMGAWSDYLLTLILINSANLMTLQLRVSQFIGQLGANFFPQYAAGVIISTAPTVILYTIFHKQIINGTTLAGALKG
jgi:ABC-type glycerol-3-phosphate transport system permease component